MKGMILAAGLGTRLKPFTDHHPKALVPVLGKSLLRRNVEYLHSFGITEMIVNIHHFPDQMREEITAINNSGFSVTVSDETADVLETGGGLKKAAGFFQHSDEPFVLMNADILTDLDLHTMVADHLTHNPLATLAVSERPASRMLLFDDTGKLCGWQNENNGELKGAPGEKKAFSGIHIISPGIFPLITESGKFSVIDLYLRLSAVKTIRAFEHRGTKFIDVGKPGSIENAQEMFG
ncbi:MAG: nucleotidyltransferase family protein [Ferruginibacter sp.]